MSGPEVYRLPVSPQEAGSRLDAYLARRLASLSRTQAQRLIQQGHVQVERGRAEASYRLRGGEVIVVQLPPPRPPALTPQPLPLQVLYEDADLLVVNKPPGLVVHPAPGHAQDTLVNALLYHCRTLSGIGGELRPGIVHRLDKDTSGLLLVAKHDRSHRHLAAQLKARRLQRRYVALVRGRPPAPQGTIDAPIARHPRQRHKMAVVPGGRPARTHYQVLATWGPVSMLQLTLETGRTHQIRVHLAHLGHPVLGDPLYGGGSLRCPQHPEVERALRAWKRQALHAEWIRFQHPSSGAWLEFSAPLPEDLAALIALLQQAYAGAPDFPPADGAAQS
ncbi:MAG: putative RNA pseudouridine synthase [Candidatus Tectimicrobiota bacterium]|nr:MAG: putative RNA pseudouridine synthase [Candidatus Tectomicrobia bacterium]